MKMQDKVQDLVKALTRRRSQLVKKAQQAKRDLADPGQQLSARDYLELVTLIDSTEENDRDNDPGDKKKTRKIKSVFAVGNSDFEIEVRIENVCRQDGDDVAARCKLWKLENYIWSGEKEEWTAAMDKSAIQEKDVDRFVYGVTHAMLTHLESKYGRVSRDEVPIGFTAKDMAGGLRLSYGAVQSFEIEERGYFYSSQEF